MYRRYSQTNGANVSLAQMKRSRIKDLLILVLFALLAAALVIGIPAVLKDNDTRSSYIQQIQSECEEAVRQAETLSRTGGVDSYLTLARIRSNLYAIQTVSSLNAYQGGGILVSEDRITTLQNIVDGYFDYLNRGQATGEYQTTLQIALEELRETVNALN